MQHVQEESGILHDKLSCSQTASCGAEVPALNAVSTDTASTSQDYAVAAEGKICAASQADASVAIIVNPSPEP
jgi:hypothetical protein